MLFVTLGIAGAAAGQGTAQPGQTAPGAALNTDPGRTIHFAPPELKPGIPTVWLVGDSTVRNGRGDGANNQMGWGDELAPYLDLNKVNLANRAIGGRSSKTYITEGHWNEVLEMIKPGDIVLIQFGHNDSGVPDEPTRARASLPGVGDETKEIENPILKQHETVRTFGWYLRKYVADTRAKGATPILCSLIPRKLWKDGKIARNTDTYAGWTHEVAAETKTDFINLNEITARKYDALGQAAVEPLFGDPHTHTTAAGAIMNAESVVAGLKALPKDPLAGDFSAKGKAIAAYRVE
jgi:lysophospholipase L1-like esterase